MGIAKSLMIVFTITFALTATDAIATDVVYRWVDDKGVVHFGDRTAASADAEKVNIHRSTTVNALTAAAEPAGDAESPSIYQQPAEPSIAQQRRDERAKNRRKAAELERAIAAACIQRHGIVAQLEPATRVMVKGADGEVYRLDDNERLKALDEAKSYIAGNCDK